MGLNYFNFARNQGFQYLCLQTIYMSAHFSKILPAILLTILTSFGIFIPTSQCHCLQTYYNHICLYSSNSNIILTSKVVDSISFSGPALSTSIGILFHPYFLPLILSTFSPYRFLQLLNVDFQQHVSLLATIRSPSTLLLAL